MTHESPARDAVELDCYDAGILSDFGGGNVEWWQDYLRAELERAHEFYQSQVTTPSPSSEYARGIEDAAKVADGALVSGNDQWCRGSIDTSRKIARLIRALSTTHAQPQEGIGAMHLLHPMFIKFLEDMEDNETLARVIEVFDAWSKQALTAQPQEGVVPDGWVMVPREPTEAMITYAAEDVHHGIAAQVWSAMLAAAPKEAN